MPTTGLSGAVRVFTQDRAGTVAGGGMLPRAAAKKFGKELVRQGSEEFRAIFLSENAKIQDAEAIFAEMKRKGSVLV